MNLLGVILSTYVWWDSYVWFVV